MPDVATTITSAGLPSVSWTDGEWHPDDMIVWLSPIGGAVLFFLLGGSGMSLLVGLGVGAAGGVAVYRGFLKFRKRSRRCALVRTAQGLMFVASPDIGRSHKNSIPYAELMGFAVVTASEWFDRRRDRSKQAGTEIVDPLVILAHRRNGTQMILASHVGSQQEMLDLHVELTDAFITQRPRWR